MWIGGWTWISQPPWVILAQGLLLWEFNLVLSNSQTGAVPLCHSLSVRTGHQRVIKSVKLLQQKVKREKQSFLQLCSPAQSSSGVWTDPSWSFTHRVFDKSYSSWTHPSWSSLGTLLSAVAGVFATFGWHYSQKYPGSTSDTEETQYLCYMFFPPNVFLNCIC